MPKVIDYSQPINRASPLNRGLVSRWMAVPWYMSGPRFIDLAGRNHGTLTNGPTWQGAFGRPGGFGSLRFTSANPPMEAALTTTGSTSYTNWTIRCWYYPPSSGSGDGHMIRNSPDGSIALNGANIATWTGGAFLQTSGGYTTDTWNYVAITGDGTNIRFYSGGSIISTQASSAARGQIASIGRYFSSSGFTGWIDDVVMLSRTLSDQEIFTDYQDSRRGSPETLNWQRRTTVFDMGGGGGGGATTSPWYYYAQQ